MNTFTVTGFGRSLTVRHNPTGQKCMLANYADFNFGTDTAPLTVGMSGFPEAWTRFMNEHPRETLDMYFPDLLDGMK